MSKKNEIAADICLYGAGHCGYGWGAQTADSKLYGTCDIDRTAGATAALWAAIDCLHRNGYRGIVRIFAPGGAVVALARIDGMRPYFGDLKWQAAPGWVISAEELLAHAE